MTNSRGYVLLWSVQYCILHMLAGNNAEYYLPSIIWNPSNPILQRKHWDKVINLQTFDILTFVCANTELYISGSETVMSRFYLHHNLYVKEIPSDIKDYTGACNITGAKFIKYCNKPDVFLYQKIQINKDQAKITLPKFQPGKDYMFFATSDGSLKSLDASINCTMVFRIHYVQPNEKRPEPSCLLLGRNEVCEKRPNITNPGCEEIVPNVRTSSTNTTITVYFQQPSNTLCNITSYGVCYKEAGTDDGWTEILVPSSQGNVLVKNLKSSSKYNVRVRAYRYQEVGKYSKEITANTEYTPPRVSPRVGDKGDSMHGLSVFVGIVIGVVATLAVCGVACWCYVKRHRAKTCKEHDDDVKENDTNMEEVALNVGYRDSRLAQGWKLPNISEDDRAFVSRA